MYTSIFNPIDWHAVGISVLQTFTLYWILLLGIKLVGRRIFGSIGPQDLILLLLISEACDLGLTVEDAGYWGSIFSVLTILLTGALVEHITPLRKLLENTPLLLVKDGRPIASKLKQTLIEESDLETAARGYGVPGIAAFECMMLESDGQITGVLKPEFRGVNSTQKSSVI